MDDIQFLLELNNKKPVTQPSALVHEYAEKKRILPPDTPIPGPWRNSKTPYTIEIMGNMSPFSPIIHTLWMKGAQIGATAGPAENTLAYWMDECPAPILFISATEGLLEKWATKRLEPLIDSCGFRDKIFAQVENKGSRRTGDKIFTKEFIGGSLTLASAQSASGLRSDSIRILIRDEIDGAPKLLRTGEGNWLDVSLARTNAWGARKKILDISTPTLEDTSEIYAGFLEGDQRYYHVPCPFCGKYQVLEFGLDKKQAHGLKAETEAGVLIGAYYVCEYCGDAFFNNHKTAMLAAGRWVPTRDSSDTAKRSYQLSSMYSPVGMLSWRELYQRYIQAQNKPDGMRSFTNLYLGLPYKESGSRPKIDEIIELRGGYKSGSVPEGVLFITIGADVQRGSQDSRKDNPARIELEVLGIGAGYRTWSIGYFVFYGPIEDPTEGAWGKLNEWAMAGGLTFKKHDGSDISASLVFVDSGDGPNTDSVYRFTDGWVNTYPIKGVQALKKGKHERPDERLDEVSQMNFKRYRAVKLPGERMLYDISTNYYKWHVYNNLKIKQKDPDKVPPGFCSFPADYKEDYFLGLTAEECRKNGAFFCPRHKANEPLDCRVYALCAADVYLDNLVADFRASAKHRGATPDQLTKINHRSVIDLLEKRS